MGTVSFAHTGLDATKVAREALVRGDAIARRLPRGYSKLADQLRRALLGAYLQFTEGVAREGLDRKTRLRVARAEASEAAAALEAVQALGLARDEKEVEAVIVLLSRFTAMVTKLGALAPTDMTVSLDPKPD